MQQFKCKKNNNNDDEAYNSEDEHIIEMKKLKRAKVSSVQPINEVDLKYVDIAELSKRLSKKGLRIFQVGKDGNCLFRAVAHQLYGDEKMYDDVRKRCMDYMEKERDHYSQFVTEDFNQYISRKRNDAVYGNHLELQAIAEIYNRPILVYTSTEDPINLFQEEYQTDSSPMRLSYHYGNHYNSVYDLNQPSVGVGLGLPGYDPAEADKRVVKEAIQESEREVINKELLTAVKQDSADDQFVKEVMIDSETSVLNQQLLDATLKQSEAEKVEKEKEMINKAMEDSLAAHLEEEMISTAKKESALLDVDECEAQMINTATKESVLQMAQEDEFYFIEEQSILEEQILEQAKRESLKYFRK